MADILIRNGTVVDGTGAPAFAADVRIAGDTIVEVGSNLEARGERVVDAAGCHVSPGFIESHTHYDASMWWQPDLDPLPGLWRDDDDHGQLRLFSMAPLHPKPRKLRPR
jgi:N-acyl-D-amino-acid deacylase